MGSCSCDALWPYRIGGRLRGLVSLEVSNVRDNYERLMISYDVRSQPRNQNNLRRVLGDDIDTHDTESYRTLL